MVTVTVSFRCTGGMPQGMSLFALPEIESDNELPKLPETGFENLDFFNIFSWVRLTEMITVSPVIESNRKKTFLMQNRSDLERLI